MPFFGLFRPFFGLFWSKMARNEKLHIMLKLGFFDAANRMAQKFLPKNGVFCHFLAFLGNFWPFSIKNVSKRNHYFMVNWYFSTLWIWWLKKLLPKNGSFCHFMALLDHFVAFLCHSFGCLWPKMAQKDIPHLMVK